MIPQSPQHSMPRSISDPANMYPSNPGVHGAARPPPYHSASTGHQQNQFVATAYPAAAMGQPYPVGVAPMSSVPYSQPANYGTVRPVNGLGNQLLGNAVNGAASGIAQATTQALIQGLIGGGGGGGGDVGFVNHVDATGGGAGTVDGSLYVDSGGYGGTDLGYDAAGGDVSYY
ncbi:ALG-2 interacting protein X-like [Dorcoceras hygrometricum]|uniref:ALG-2 interacting protein X-like n=1 Tax=Dorcoceras hygrometricum TaxID=472368 RepID=A0A2Z7CG55_9LAMI|nr:ALG-2 interacting protein X-like [Dorcoceras hygrometricum]